MTVRESRDERDQHRSPVHATSSAVDKPEFEPALRATIHSAAVPEVAIGRAIKAALWNVDEPFFGDLERLTVDGFAVFKKAGFMS